MAKVITIDGKDYSIEFSIEASLYNDCTEKTVGLMTDMMMAAGENKVREMLTGLSDVPQTTLVMFYAGLMEHHGADGDGSVKSLADAKRLVKLYFAEHKDDDLGNFYALMELLIEQMSVDGFFKQIGLQQMMEEFANQQVEEEKPKKTKAKAGAK